MMEFDERDAEILATREQLFNQVDGPRVGDFLRVADGMLRFTHDWDDSIQTTVKPGHSCYGDASFYLSDGYVSFSGSLDPAIDKMKLKDTGEKQKGGFWFFHHNFPGGGRGVHFEMTCRVFIQVKTMDDWHQDGRDLGKYLQIGDAVAEDVADYFLGVLPPATQLSNLIQIGEPNDHIRGRATFATIYKTGGIWRWMGFCYRGEVTEP